MSLALLCSEDDKLEAARYVTIFIDSIGCFVFEVYKFCE